MNTAATNPPLHLLFDSHDVPRIHATLTRPEFGVFWNAARNADLADDEQFLRHEIRLNEPVRDLARAANILHRCAFVHRIEPDARHLALARLALERMLAYRRWDWIIEAGRDTAGIMRNGSTTVSAVLAADWLAGDLSAAEHAALRHHIETEAGPAAERAVFGMTHHDQVVGWTMDPDATGFDLLDVSQWPAILDRSNLRVIATSGLAAAAAYLHGRHPQAERWATMAADSLRLFAARQPADASFPEGPSYWNFTYTYFIVSLELLHRRCGHDMRDILDFPAMARYVQATTMPTHGNPADCINIGDANIASGAEPLAWIGRHYRDTTAAFLLAQPGCIRATPVNAWGAIWFDPTVPARRAADLALDRTVVPGIVLSRSGWELTDSVVSFRSGDPENHEHADRNSLIFAAHGERLLHDPLKASYSRTDPKWLLRLTAAHTSVLINGQGHVYHEGEEGTNASTATTLLTDHRLGHGWMHATSDATDAYRRAALPVMRMQRTVVFLKPDVLIVFDELQLSAPLPVHTRWQVYNDDGHGDVTADTATFTITRPHASLHARILGGGDFTVTTNRLPLPPEGGTYPFAEITSAAALNHTLITLCTAAPNGGAHGNIVAARDNDTWSITGTHRGQEVCVQLKPQNDRPPVVLL